MIEKRVWDKYSSYDAQHDEFITECYCSNCGEYLGAKDSTYLESNNTLNDNMRFCPKCGKILSRIDSNRTCNCQHNNNSKDNEPCCRCDSRKTNADRIRNMSDEELMNTLFDSCLEYMHIDECPYADMNIGMCKKCISEWLQSKAE